MKKQIIPIIITESETCTAGTAKAIVSPVTTPATVVTLATVVCCSVVNCCCVIVIGINKAKE